jgi:D-3-phosphoglycerate dehydrogenase
MSKTVLLATEKAFAASAADAIERVLAQAGYSLKKLENYKESSELVAAVSDVDALIIRSDLATKEVIDAATNLKVITRAGAGFDNIDLEAAKSREIVVQNTPGANANAVAELVFGMMVTVVRNNFDGTSGTELKGKTLALHGCGNVSVNVIRVAKGFGMRCISYDPFLKPEQISERGAEPVDSVAALFHADFVSLHIPATAETKGSINKDLLVSMPKGGTLINTARKEVIHEEGLLEAFVERPDLRYITDVKPDNLEALRSACGDKADKRVLCTVKKMGAQTLEANNNAGIQAAEQIVAFFERGEKGPWVNRW